VVTIARALDVIMREITGRMVNPFQLPARIPTPANVRFRSATTELNAFIGSMLAHHKEENIDDDLLAMLLEARGEDAESISDYQWRYEVMTLFIAGYETVALALTWSLYLLSQNPEVEAKLADELQTVLGGHPPSAEHYPKLVYTEMVIKETLRLYPPVWFLGARVARSTCRFGPYAMPAGTIITMSPWVTHQDARYFKNPTRFDPERWTVERTKQIPKYSYFPFGGGVRLCIGYAYAMMEAVLVLATLVQSARFALVPGHPAVPQPLITLRPRYGMKMVISKNQRSDGR
jgi:cytochrome P450